MGVGSSWYFGRAQEQLDAEPSHLCLDLLYCSGPPQIILEYQRSMDGQADMISLCPYQYIVYQYIWKRMIVFGCN